MISAPAIGWRDASLLRRVSAGGQVEQPSEVNSSTRTGVRSVWAGADCGAAARGGFAAEVVNRIVAKARRGSVFFIFVTPLKDSRWFSDGAMFSSMREILLWKSVSEKK